MTYFGLRCWGQAVILKNFAPGGMHLTWNFRAWDAVRSWTPNHVPVWTTRTEAMFECYSPCVGRWSSFGSATPETSSQSLLRDSAFTSRNGLGLQLGNFTSLVLSQMILHKSHTAPSIGSTIKYRALWKSCCVHVYRIFPYHIFLEEEVRSKGNPTSQ